MWVGIGINVIKKILGKRYILIQGFLLKSDGGFILNHTGGKIIINVRQYEQS